jgi:predicted DsbA family dithiol-disulfide isomerase
MPLVLHRPAPAGGGAGTPAGRRCRAPRANPLASLPVESGLRLEGVARKTYVENKFGGPERAAQIYARVSAAGATAGIPFAFDRILRQPNTRDAHRLIAWAQARGDASDLVERLFRAYFIDGRYIGDHEVLAAIAGEAGFDSVAARTLLESDEGVAAIALMDRRAREIGVQGVPFFIFNQHIAVSGAQEPGVLLDVIAQAKAA